MNERPIYKAPELELIAFEAADVLTESGSLSNGFAGVDDPLI